MMSKNLPSLYSFEEDWLGNLTDFWGIWRRAWIALVRASSGLSP